jgi:uncharacterized protein (TIGR00375 family)
MNISSLYKWGKIKGINVIGTGDFTHPEWYKELSEKLEPAEPGLFRLKEEFAKEEDKSIPDSCKENLIRFILTVEISNIYSKNEKVRKLHNVVIAPDFKIAAEINNRLSKIGNLKADGRPILGMDSKDLVKITYEASPDAFFFPAHIWTPWFAMFGSKSGFDTIEETFEEESHKIKAIETGLSSDPFMNWRLSQLDDVTLVSNSDAHSSAKLGREANILDCKLDYYEIINAIKTGDERFVGTLEFFPEEGKYHHDGHRLCQISLSPEETEKYKNICPRCGKPLVIGVMNRVGSIADRDANYKPKSHKKVEYIIPLPEVIAEIKGMKSTKSKTVETEYKQIYSALGSDFDILRKISIKEIRSQGFAELAYAVDKIRKKDVFVEAGYDGVYGTIKVFESNNAKKSISGQMGLI